MRKFLLSIALLVAVALTATSAFATYGTKLPGGKTFKMYNENAELVGTLTVSADGNTVSGVRATPQGPMPFSYAWTSAFGRYEDPDPDDDSYLIFTNGAAENEFFWRHGPPETYGGFLMLVT